MAASGPAGGAATGAEEVSPTSATRKMAAQVASGLGHGDPQAANAAGRQKRASREVSDALYSFKLLEALRDGDAAALQPFLAKAAGTSAAGSSEAGSSEIKELTSPLHLAARCAEDSTFALLLSSRGDGAGQQPQLDVNGQESHHGNTPLHIASVTGRAEIVRMLLERPDIDDTLRNKDGKDPMEVAPTPEIATLFQVSRAELNVTFLNAVAAYERGKEDAAARIYSFLDKKRYRVLDVNALVPETGSTLLHAAVMRKDTRMIETAARKGADVFCRDRKGKRVLDITKDEKIRALLRQLTNTDRGLMATPSQTALAPPSFKGYIGKWTNLAAGYKPRWFVLENGTLSYFRSQEDEGKQMRASINLRFAKIRADSGDQLRFEIHSESTGKSAVKLFLRASHPVERARWVQLLQQTQDFFNIERSQAQSQVGSNLNSLAGTRNHSAASLVQPQPIRAAINTSGSPPSGNGFAGGVPLAKTPSLTLNRGVTPPPFRPASGLSDRSSRQMHALTTLPPGVPPAAMLGTSYDTPSLLSHVSDSPNVEKEGYEFSLAGDEAGTDAGSAAAHGGKRVLPHEGDFVLVGNSLTAQTELAHNLTSALAPSDASTALQQSLASLKQLLVQYQGIVADREGYLMRRYEQEIQAKLLWEENMKTLAQQHAEMEEALREASEENARKRRALREMRGSLLTSPGSVGNLRSPEKEPRSAILDQGSLAARRDAPSRINLDGANDTIGGVGVPTSSSDAYRDSVDDDDEFFDAIETGNLPNLHVEKQLLSPAENDTPLDTRVVEEKAYEPYKHLRAKLPIGKDDRPSVSLWAILKNNIGKDLTKISFPVSFNEPTSMLQRMAEDMEFSECLDVASKCQDSTKRIAYVGAFAMSNYSSTIGRIAKPFNPLLGETFEYVSPDKKFRYLSEQVSHHPPISACIAESPTWQYLGCVDAKNKFTGRTFEIRPTGVAHVNLRLPKESATGKMQPVPGRPNLVQEHYTWNKVTTSVSGFIVGSPTIDHFGDMEITNHATGDRCVLTFKPRGWRGKDAYEIRGTVYDASGKQVWDIAGRWNSQLVARRVGAGSGDLNPDENVKEPAPAVDSAGPAPAAEYLLLWKNSDKPQTPFNLPPFAITLNDLPDGLHPWLPPTDCRLRPDLRAFESGKFDQANGLKQSLEELQRATRKKREAGELPEHEPRWFKRTTDPDSKDTLWAPVTAPHPSIPGFNGPAYWHERDRVGAIKSEKGEQAAEWPNVYHIFGEFEV